MKVPSARLSHAVIYIFVIICSSSLHQVHTWACWRIAVDQTKKWDHPQRSDITHKTTWNEKKHVFIQIDDTKKSHTYSTLLRRSCLISTEAGSYYGHCLCKPQMRLLYGMLVYIYKFFTYLHVREYCNEPLVITWIMYLEEIINKPQ